MEKMFSKIQTDVNYRITPKFSKSVYVKSSLEN